MRAGRYVLPLVALIGVGAAGTTATPLAVSWGRAIGVPGFAALNTGGDTRVDSISCARAGNCAAGGGYSTISGGQAFVVSESKGVWRKAIAVPGLAALNVGGSAEVYSVSCAAPGSCSAGGYYFGDGGDQAFVVTEKNGVWRKAIEVPGSAALNAGDTAKVDAVSCAKPGFCAAGGGYSDGSSRAQAFVVNQRNGIWRKAVKVRGLAARNVDGNANVTSISCASSGSCSAGGYYTDGSDHRHAFVVNEKNGIWRRAVDVTGSALLHARDAVVNSVSCPSAGACTAAGSYIGGSSHRQAFVVNERHGIWRKAIKVPGTAALNTGGDARVASISCTGAGSCSAGGYYTDESGNLEAFVVNKTNGVWRKAIEVPGSAALNAGGTAEVTSISCAKPGACVAGGRYKDGVGGSEPFLAAERHGVWRTAVDVPGSAALNVGGNGRVTSISCVTTGRCAALGYYNDSNHFIQAFVTTP